MQLFTHFIIKMSYVGSWRIVLRTITTTRQNNYSHQLLRSALMSMTVYIIIIPNVTLMTLSYHGYHRQLNQPSYHYWPVDAPPSTADTIIVSSRAPLISEGSRFFTFWPWDPFHSDFGSVSFGPWTTKVRTPVSGQSPRVQQEGLDYHIVLQLCTGVPREGKVI